MTTNQPSMQLGLHQTPKILTRNRKHETRKKVTATHFLPGVQQRRPLKQLDWLNFSVAFGGIQPTRLD